MQLEKQYEHYFKNSVASKTKEFRCLLPIKTKEGIEKRISAKSNFIDYESNKEIDVTLSEQFQDNNVNDHNNKNISTSEVISAIQLLACRQEKLKFIKYSIGVLSSEILENPESKLNNLSLLLNYMDEGDPEVYITVKKMTIASLFEIFQDLLPSYNIWLLEKNKIKLKKETLLLHNHEDLLLKCYRQYLEKLERIASTIKNSKQIHSLKECDINLALFVIDCITKLLVTRPYFNFSSNIAHFLIPFLDNKQSSIRHTVAKCFIQIFRQDFSGQLTLTIVRCLNQYIKVHKQSIHLEVIEILLSLKIEDVNLDKNRDEFCNHKKLFLRRNGVLALSKKEKKRKTKLEQIKKEILETKAEEIKNKSQLKMFTEITALLFTIYLRLLKDSPDGPIFSSCIEGLSKFSQYINIDYYEDVLNLLNNLLHKNNLTCIERMQCIKTVFTILSGQTSTLSIDPVRFYVHLYRIMLYIHLEEKVICREDLIENFSYIFINHCTNIAQYYLIAFLKRLFTMMINLQHDCIMGIVWIIREILNNVKFASTVLDTEDNGSFIYLPDLNDFEYSNASSSSWWEIVALLRYYHPSIQHTVKIGLLNGPSKMKNSVGKNILKLSPKEIFLQYSSSAGIFKPTVIKPKHFMLRNIRRPIFNNTFTDLSNIIQFQKVFNDDYFNLFQELR